MQRDAARHQILARENSLGRMPLDNGRDKSADVPARVGRVDSIVANDLLWRKLPACVGRVNWRFPINCLTSQNVKFDDWSVGR